MYIIQYRSLTMSSKTFKIIFIITMLVLGGSTYLTLSALRYKPDFERYDVLTEIWIGIAISYGFIGTAYGIRYAILKKKY